MHIILQACLSAFRKELCAYWTHAVCVFEVHVSVISSLEIIEYVAHSSEECDCDATQGYPGS